MKERTQYERSFKNINEYFCKEYIQNLDIKHSRGQVIALKELSM